MSVQARVWVAMCAAWIVVIWSWGPFHLAMAVDDTFYYFKTAFHLSRGVGSTFDGINPTNGYHPLWLGMLALAFSFVGDDMVFFSHLAFTVQVLMIWGGGVILSRAKGGGPHVLSALALVMLNPFAAKIVLCGQETALQLLLTSMVLHSWSWLRVSHDERRRRALWVGLGLLCALAILARLDTIFFCVLLLAMPVVLPSDAERTSGLAERFRLATYGLTACGAGLLPYLIFNVVVYAHLTPVSGAVKFSLSEDEIASIGARLTLILGALASWLLIWRATRQRPSGRPPLLFAALAGCLALAIYNFGVRGEMSSGLVRIWYLEPYLVVLALAGGAVLQRAVRDRPTRAVAGTVAAVWMILSVLSWQYRLDPRSYGLYAAAEGASRWLEREGEPNLVAAAWDAGFAGAFTKKPVMNLDGLINSWDFKEHYLDTGNVDQFILRRQPVDYVVQYAWADTLKRIARRFAQSPRPVAPMPHTTVTGSTDASDRSGRWGVDLASFHVARVECVMVRVAYRPTAPGVAAYYFVLRREPDERPTLAEFALVNEHNTSCEGSDSAPVVSASR